MPTKCRIEYSKGQFGFFLKGIFYFLKMEKKKIIKINKYKKKPTRFGSTNSCQLFHVYRLHSAKGEELFAVYEHEDY